MPPTRPGPSPGPGRAAAMALATVVTAGLVVAGAPSSVAALQTAAAAAAPVPGRPLPPPPPPPGSDGARVPVALGVYLLQVTEVDQIAQSVRVDGYLTARWWDPRLAFDASVWGDTLKEYRDDDAAALLGGDVWWPSMEFVNADGGARMDRHWLTVNARGEVGLSVRFAATVTSEMDLRRFPFDRQTLRIPVESYFHDIDEVVFVEDPTNTGYDAGHQLPEWRIEDATAAVDVHDYSKADQLGDFYGSYSRFTFALDVERESRFYLWKVLLPLSLIILASWASFWIRETAVLSVAFGLLLTLVAFQFAISDSMPKVPYMTFMDMVLTLGYLSVGLSIPLLIAVRWREEADRGRRERRLLSVCRFAFPAGFVAALLVAAVVML